MSDEKPAERPPLADALLGAADVLYGMTVDDFTAARNDRVKAAKADGDKELAEALSKLTKPSVPAWVVNLLVRERADQISQLLELGASLREAQADLDREELRTLTAQRRRLVSAVASEGAAVADDYGHKLTSGVLDEVKQTLNAAMIDATAAEAVRSGRLLRTIAADGLEPADLSEAVALGDEDPSSSAGPSKSTHEKPNRPISLEEKRRAKEREQAAADAEAAAQDAEEAAERERAASAAVDEAKKLVTQKTRESDDLREQLHQLRLQLTKAEDDLESAQDSLTATNQRHRAAVRAADAAASEAEAARERLRQLK